MIANSDIRGGKLPETMEEKIDKLVVAMHQLKISATLQASTNAQVSETLKKLIDTVYGDFSNGRRGLYNEMKDMRQEIERIKIENQVPKNMFRSIIEKAIWLFLGGILIVLITHMNEWLGIK